MQRDIDLTGHPISITTVICHRHFKGIVETHLHNIQEVCRTLSHKQAHLYILRLIRDTASQQTSSGSNLSTTSYQQFY